MLEGCKARSGLPPSLSGPTQCGPKAHELELPADVLDVLVDHADVLRHHGRLEGALDVLARAIESSPTALRRLEGGRGDLIANLGAFVVASRCETGGRVQRPPVRPSGHSAG